MTKKTVKKVVKEKTKRYWQGVGRRKTAHAVVRLFLNCKEIVVNDKSPLEYFGTETPISLFRQPLEVCGLLSKFGLSAKVRGGGKYAQVEAIRLGVARALIEYDPKLKGTLRKEGFLTRDPREKERKKPGLKRARRAPQWQKR